MAAPCWIPGSAIYLSGQPARARGIIPMHSVWNILIDIMPVLGCALAITMIPLLSDGPPGSRTEAEGPDEAKGSDSPS
jgi:hypothetical protein